MDSAKSRQIQWPCAGAGAPTWECGDLQIRSDQSLSCVRLFATPWIAARQASLSITNSRSGDLRLTQTEVENTQVCWVLQNCCTFVLERVPPPWAFQRLPLCVKASPHGDTSHYMANYRCVWFPLFFLIIIDCIIIKKKKKKSRKKCARQEACLCLSYKAHLINYKF